MMFLGIDPGKTGAIAIINADGQCDCILPIPVVKPSGSGRAEYDVPAIVEALTRWTRDPSFVTIERVVPLPSKMVQKGGSLANFNRGVTAAFGWVCAALAIPYQLVTPQRWHRSMLEGVPLHAGKERSILAAKQLFPNVSLRVSTRARKDSHDIAEALLLAEYGRRTMKGREA